MIQTVPSPGRSNTNLHLTAFDVFERSTAESSPHWLQAIRKAGISYFAELGFPTVKDEEWRYTNVGPIARLPFRTRVEDRLSPDLVETHGFGLDCYRLVFSNGSFLPALSNVALQGTETTPEGGIIGTLSSALRTATKHNSPTNDAVFLLPALRKHLGRHARANENAFVALNTAFIYDAAVVVLPGKVKLTKPIHLLHFTSSPKEPITTFPRTLIVAGPESEAKVIEHYVGFEAQEYFSSAVTEIDLEEGARIEHCKLQQESTAGYHIATIQARQAARSHLLSHSISIGAKLARNNINGVLDGSGIECTLNGLYLGKGDQLVDHHTALEHAKPHCNSHEFYHGILNDRATGVFNGKIFVRPDAQKTDAKQTNRNLLLSDDATINTKPQLEIFADDVRCTHGATVGQLEEEAIFYLRARGIGLDNARRMLVHAFAADIVNRITIEEVREKLDQHLFDLFEK
jgi:Fe-S cluster assembly protein SufD